MEADQAFQADRKAMQAAIKDINLILEPKPKLNIIGSAEFLGKQIITTIAACIGEDGEGNPIWTDEKAEGLSEGTIKVYESLVAQAVDAGTESVEQPTTTVGETSDAPTETLTEIPEGECEAFLKSAGPREEDQECAECIRSAECAAKAAEAKKSKTKTTKKKSTGDKPAGEKKPGVIAAIFEMIKGAPHSKAEILARLVAKFPDRDEKSMKATINVQLPGRMAKDKKVTIAKGEDGKYFVKA
jgi:hypothetical protein